jgi:hypothetical protein
MNSVLEIAAGSQMRSEFTSEAGLGSLFSSRKGVRNLLETMAVHRSRNELSSMVNDRPRVNPAVHLRLFSQVPRRREHL